MLCPCLVNNGHPSEVGSKKGGGGGGGADDDMPFALEPEFLCSRSRRVMRVSRDCRLIG